MAHLAEVGGSHDAKRAAEEIPGYAPRAGVGPATDILERARADFPASAGDGELGRLVLLFFGVIPRLGVIHAVEELNHPSSADRQQRRLERQADLSAHMVCRDEPSGVRPPAAAGLFPRQPGAEQYE